MPGGMSWPSYLTFASTAILTMLLGASVVHNIYKPDLVSSKHLLKVWLKLLTRLRCLHNLS